jgi:PTH1 family peptidyl-tRNA hydrolase
MKLLVGLGNPGTQYSQTRHNAGALFLEHLGRLCGVSVHQVKFKSLYGKGFLFGKETVFLFPQTYMNLSGAAVREAMTFFKIAVPDTYVIFDDLDLSPGAVRLRVGGGHGGHNGVRSILEELGSDHFHRIKIGIGKAEHKSATQSHVLGKFTDSEMATLESESFPLAVGRLEMLFKAPTAG